MRSPRALLKLIGFAFAGAVLGLWLGGSVAADIGPFETTVSARPSLGGATSVRLAPLGSIDLETHDAPLRLELRVDELRLEDARAIALDATVLETVEDEVAADVRRSLIGLGLRCLAVAVLGGVLGALIAVRGLRPAVVGALVGLSLVVSVSALTAFTFDPDAVAEPEYTGLLTIAPAAVGDVETLVDGFDQYRTQLVELVGNVANLYQAAQGLPRVTPDAVSAVVLHVSDIHLNPQAFDLIDLLVDQFDVGVVADTGDLTDWGSEPENFLLDRVRQLPVPYVWVRGNHDSGATEDAMRSVPNAVVLDGDAATVGGLRFWGVADERYTPNKDQPAGTDLERDRASAVAPRVASMLARDEPPAIDIAMVHDERMAADLGGEVPLILAGHLHRAKEGKIGATRLLVEGSTGGAGLRALQSESPEPLTCTLLYFDRRQALVAYDRVTVDGLGEQGVRIQRHVVG
jgi:predicted phosphodiesterase